MKMNTSKLKWIKSLGVTAGQWIMYDGTNPVYNMTPGKPYQLVNANLSGSVLGIVNDIGNTITDGRGRNWYVTTAPAATPAPLKKWKELSDDEKGALLLANHLGKGIEMDTGWGGKEEWETIPRPIFVDNNVYRVANPAIKAAELRLKVANDELLEAQEALAALQAA